jgi:hypothetical protein
VDALLLRLVDSVAFNDGGNLPDGGTYSKRIGKCRANIKSKRRKRLAAATEPNTTNGRLLFSAF